SGFRVLISLNWIRDFVDLPADFDPKELAERFTRTTAEVDGIHSVQISAKGLIAAKVGRVMPLSDGKNLSSVELGIGHGKTVGTVSAAQGLKAGQTVLFAPVGSSLSKFGVIQASKVGGKASEGFILPAEAVGITLSAQEGVFLAGTVEPGTVFEPSVFDDWIMEVDNKSITHRPDLWGHYGIAREIAAIFRVPLKPYPVTPLAELERASAKEVSIKVAAPEACRRYSGLVLTGVPFQSGPLWMQLRLGRVGLRPISALVDLTNYIMLDLGQPMHAFDAAKVDRIEVDWAKPGERFRTLDGVDRALPPKTLMIQGHGQSIAIAGVMGGHETEVTAETSSLLLESANFDAATIRRTATSLELRTDASARFEKSLDPTNTALSIQRFVYLAKPEYPQLALQTRLSDCYPRPFPPIEIPVRIGRISKAVGRVVESDEIRRILTPLGFQVGGDSTALHIGVPSFRATKDVSIEADVIEEIARCIGYGAISAAMPLVSVRSFAPNALHQLEQATIRYFTDVHRFHEIHAYTWYDDAWLKQIRAMPGHCVELRNPAAEGFAKLRRTVIPGLLAASVKNRFHYSAFSLLEVGSVFEPTTPGGGAEHRHVGLIVARRGKKLDDAVFDDLKRSIEEWAWCGFHRSVSYLRGKENQDRPWESFSRMGEVVVEDQSIGRIGVLDVSIRRAMDEHLGAWSIAWAELRLNGLESLPPKTEKLGRIPEFPLIEVDFSLLVPATTAYSVVAGQFATLGFPLLREVRYVGSYEGGAIPSDRRSHTFRAVIGHENRTLTDADADAFRSDFERHVRQFGYEIRQ
ncbi:MAG: phenylalanine--tRNA ligase subunit beta, partial [Planctomycetota bacterium]